jgi:hypothetical protein
LDPTNPYEAYPGGDLVWKGLNDLQERRITDEALLVMIAEDRLVEIGIEVPPPLDVPLPYEHTLYHRLSERLDNHAHFEYNALIARVVSFCNSYAQANKAPSDTHASYP